MCVSVRGRSKVRDGAAGLESGRGACRGAFRRWLPEEVSWHNWADRCGGRGRSALQAPLRLQGGNGDAQGRAEANGAGQGMD